MFRSILLAGLVAIEITSSQKYNKLKINCRYFLKLPAHTFTNNISSIINYIHDV